MKPEFHRFLVMALLAAGAGTLIWHQSFFIAKVEKPTVPTQTVVSPWAPLFDEHTPLQVRMEMASRIDDTLTIAEIQSWTASLVQPRNGRDAANDLEVWNQIAAQLANLNTPPDSLAQFLIETLTDPSLPPALRDYSAQHLASLLNNRPPLQTAPFAARAIAALCETVTAFPQVPGSPAGTALLSLTDLASREEQRLDTHWPVLVPAVCRLIEGESTPDSLRIAAIQAAGNLRRKEFHFPLQSLLGRPGVPDAVRLAGVATLRAFADPADRELLESIGASGGFAAAAATAALQSPPFLR